MSFTKAQQAQIAQLVAATLAQLQQPQPQPQPAPKPSQRAAKRKVNTAKLAAAKQARAAKQAAGLALMQQLGKARHEVGRVYPTPAAVEDLGYSVPVGTVRCVLASTGTLFLYGANKAELGRMVLPAEHSALVRAAYASTRVVAR